MYSALFLNIVVSHGLSLVELFPTEDQSLLVSWNALFVLDLCFDVLNCISGLNFDGHCSSSKGSHEHLHATPQSQDEVDGGLLRDVVVAQSTCIIELLACKDESLLIGWDTLFILDLSLDLLDRIGRCDLKSDSLSGECANEDLH